MHAPQKIIADLLLTIDKIHSLLVEQGKDEHMPSSMADLLLLRSKFEAASSLLPASTTEALELDLYALLESEPNLRTAYLAVSYADSADMCRQRIEYFTQLAKVRPLSAKELEQRSLTEMGLREAEENFRQMLSCLE